MTPVLQQFKHDPPRSYGDCHRAALASLLDYPIGSVPNFMDGLADGDGREFARREAEFLEAERLDRVVFPVACPSLADLFRGASAWNPGRLFLLSGESVRGCCHTVVAGPDGIVHDPHPSGCGLSGPAGDGFYWLTYVHPRGATR